MKKLLQVIDYYFLGRGICLGVNVNEIGQQAITIVFDSHRVSHFYDLEQYNFELNQSNDDYCLDTGISPAVMVS